MYTTFLRRVKVRVRVRGSGSMVRVRVQGLGLGYRVRVRVRVRVQRLGGGCHYINVLKAPSSVIYLPSFGSEVNCCFDKMAKLTAVHSTVAWALTSPPWIFTARQL